MAHTDERGSGMIGFRSRALLALAIPLALMACGKRANDDRNLDSLDNELIAAGNGNAQDPAMTSALRSQIMVDPSLAKQANHDAVRPPAQPYSGAVPPVTIAGTPAGTAAATGATTSETLKTAPAPKGAACPQCKAHEQSLTLGALASRQRDGATRGCAGALHYSASWANRLPADLPLYPDARISEAAGA
ncbi:MAG: hypothetical protein ABIS14_11845, partial [Sphingomonas sp.]